MRKRITTEVLMKVADLQKQGISNTLIAQRLGVHVSALNQAIRKAAFGGTNKYGAQKTVCSANHPHPSKLECSVCEIHLARQRAGEIRNLKWQATVHLTSKVTWKVDWSFEAKPEWTLEFSEAKGVETKDFIVKRNLWKTHGHGTLTIWKGTAQRPYISKVIQPEGVTA